MSHVSSGGSGDSQLSVDPGQAWRCRDQQKAPGSTKEMGPWLTVAQDGQMAMDAVGVIGLSLLFQMATVQDQSHPPESNKTPVSAPRVPPWLSRILCSPVLHITRLQPLSLPLLCVLFLLVNLPVSR
jgi:hypothetical protein